MKRNAFLMKLRPGQEQEYRRRHDEIWPELAQELRRAGISDYSIYLDRKTGNLFAFQKLTDDNTASGLKDLPVMRRWWDAMAELMDTNPDHSPVVEPLVEVFHMD